MHASPGDTGQTDSGELLRDMIVWGVCKCTATLLHLHCSGLLREEELMQRDMERYQQRAAAAPRKPVTPEKVRHRSVATAFCKLVIVTQQCWLVSAVRWAAAIVQQCLPPGT